MGVFYGNFNPDATLLPTSEVSPVSLHQRLSLVISKRRFFSRALSTPLASSQPTHV